MDVEMEEGRGENTMDVDAPRLDLLAMVPYVAPPPKDLVVLLTRALSRLRIAKNRLRESEADREHLQIEMERL